MFTPTPIRHNIHVNKWLRYGQVDAVVVLREYRFITIHEQASFESNKRVFSGTRNYILNISELTLYLTGTRMRVSMYYNK